ncbi:MAG: hypothetical protein J6K38_02465 [Alistipes sp.]|nr:hypothetical protein [Alistipes sp.]MBP3455105.1 hypothetical protein [Alistipes sp.]
MKLPYEYRGVCLLALLFVVLPWAGWRFALHDTCATWRECRHLESRLDALGPIPAADAAMPRAAAMPELILSGALLDSVRRMAPSGVQATGYTPATTLRQDGIEIRTAQLTLADSFAGLLRTVDMLERRLTECRLQSVEWRTTTESRTRRVQLTATIYIQQLIMKPETPSEP